MKNLRLLSTVALSAACAMAMANDYLTDEVFGEPMVEIDGNTVIYSYPDAEDGIYDLFMDASLWRNQSKAINYCAADGSVIESSKIGAWDNNINFTSTLDFSAGQYLYFTEGIFQIDVYDEEYEVIEKYYSPAYTYREEGQPVSISNIAEREQGTIYNIQGMRMNQLTEGINVVNGRKVIVK